MRYGRWSSFSRDGRLLILGNHEGRAQIYDGHTFKPRGRPLLGHAGFILTADFSPDGRTVATGSSDGTVRLWDTATGRPIGSPLPGIPNAAGRRRVHPRRHPPRRRLRQRPGLPLGRTAVVLGAAACAVAGRPLTRAEWNEVLPGRSYEPACAPARP